jgi:hypothetical protein
MSKNLLNSRFTTHVSRLTVLRRRLLPMTYRLLPVLLLIFLVPMSAFATDKLIVKDSSGTNTVFKVDDAGAVTAGTITGTAITGSTVTTAKFAVTNSGFVGAGMVNPLYNYDLSGQGVARSSMHFSKNGNDVGGWITSVLDNNFFMSSGAAYDGTLGGWIQKSSDGNAIVLGSQKNGFEVWTGSGTSVGGVVALTRRLVISTNGNMGVGFTNTSQVPAYPLEMASGAYVTTGGVWTNASSRAYKENIKDLTVGQAMTALNGLTPVQYAYKIDPGEKHVGFIAEDVPALVATKDRKGVSAMDIVAVLTKVVQEQQKTIAELSAKVSGLERRLNLRGSVASVDIDPAGAR